MVDINRILEQGEPLSEFTVVISDQNGTEIKGGIYRLGDRDYVVDKLQKNIIDSYFWEPGKRQEQSK